MVQFLQKALLTSALAALAAVLLPPLALWQSLWTTAGSSMVAPLIVRPVGHGTFGAFIAGLVRCEDGAVSAAYGASLGLSNSVTLLPAFTRTAQREHGMVWARDVLSAPVDAVYICSPDHLHAPVLSASAALADVYGRLSGR